MAASRTPIVAGEGGTTLPARPTAPAGGVHNAAAPTEVALAGGAGGGVVKPAACTGGAGSGVTEQATWGEAVKGEGGGRGAGACASDGSGCSRSGSIDEAASGGGGMGGRGESG